MLGANGAGKSTWRVANREHLPQPFYDADALAQELGDYNDPVFQAAARTMVDAGISRHLGRQESCGFESTYSGRSRRAFVGAAHARGYRTDVAFIGTPSAALNEARVAWRVNAGKGHRVADAEIRRRWQACQDNLVATAHLFDRITLLENNSSAPMPCCSSRVTGWPC